MVVERPDVEAIFNAARQKPPHERTAYLDEVCGEDRELRHRVEQLLSAQAEIGSFLETPVVQRVAEELAGQASAGSTELNRGTPGDGGPASAWTSRTCRRAQAAWTA